MHRVQCSTPIVFLLAAVTIALSIAGCAGPSKYVEAEINQWTQFRRVEGGPLGPGSNRLPAPVRQGHCYRVVLASQGGMPQLTYQSEMDRDAVGFPIQPIEARSGTQGGAASLAVFGFCSQGSGTIQLRANLPANGHGVLLEAPFSSLSPTAGPDVAAAAQWLAGQQQRRTHEQRQRREQELQRRMNEFAESVSGEVRRALEVLIQSRGRYTDTILGEVRAGTQMQEALILEPNRCYIFAVVGYESTRVNANVMFTRIRNATERSDEGGGITYTVCTAPHGPIQEVNFSVEAMVPQGARHPPVFGVKIAYRRPTREERRAADLEWLRNDPEARIED